MIDKLPQRRKLPLRRLELLDLTANANVGRQRLDCPNFPIFPFLPYFLIGKPGRLSR